MRQIQLTRVLKGLFLMMTVLGVAACGEAPSTTTTSPPAATVVALSPTPPATQVPSKKTEEVTITMRDNGRSVWLKVGQHVLFALDDTLYDHWTITSSNPTLLVAERNQPLPPHTQAVYTAVARGQTTLLAKGDLICAKRNPPCLIQPRDIQIHVTVE